MGNGIRGTENGNRDAGIGIRERGKGGLGAVKLSVFDKLGIPRPPGRF